jgi:hypothetical protein
MMMCDVMTEIRDGQQTTEDRRQANSCDEKNFKKWLANTREI